jgi:membrane protease YdiL (CAAX protease family)
MIVSNERRRDMLALVFAMFLPVVIAYYYFVVIDTGAPQADGLLPKLFAAGKFVQFTFPIFFVWWFYRDRLEPELPTMHGMGWAVGFGLLVALGMFAIYFGWLKHSVLIADTPAKIFHKLEGFHCATPARFVLLGAFISVVHSMFEEYYWRWFVFGWMRKHTPVAVAIVVSSIGFTLHHIVILGVYFPGAFWTMAMPFSVCVGVGGAVWAWIYQRSGSLYAPWVSHVLIDTAIMVIGYDLVSPFWA